jgi:hypothetical protein
MNQSAKVSKGARGGGAGEPEGEAQLGEALPLALGETEVEFFEHRLEGARLPQVRFAIELRQNLDTSKRRAWSMREQVRESCIIITQMRLLLLRTRISTGRASMIGTAVSEGPMVEEMVMLEIFMSL